VRATWSYLAENGVGTVVSWSVSSGITVQTAVLAQHVPVSAIVDQSAWGRSEVRDQAGRRGIPVFAIRGRWDPYGPTATVDFWYPGGHDLTMAEDFSALCAAVAPFLAAAPPVTWPAPPAAATVLEVAAGGGDQSLGFELATHVQRACFPAGDVMVAPAGVPSLATPARVHAGVTRWLADHPTTRAVRLDAPAAAAAPRAHAITNDGWLVHPDLQAAADRRCTALRSEAATTP
jgi:hypothetical protein